MARWRKGTCPIHGVGFVVDKEAAGGPQLQSERCPKDECVLRVTLSPGKDAWHGFYGWRAGPDEIRAVLVRAGDLQDDGRPGHYARSVRTGYPLSEE